MDGRNVKMIKSDSLISISWLLVFIVFCNFSRKIVLPKHLKIIFRCHDFLLSILALTLLYTEMCPFLSL